MGSLDGRHRRGGRRRHGPDRHRGRTDRDRDPFADGRWAEFTGLQRCPLAKADAQLGERRDGQLHGGMFGGEPTQFGLYLGGDATPSGLTVRVLGEIAVAFGLKPFTVESWESDPLRWWRIERRPNRR
ncbi:MAG: hypothetical protein QM650_08715 [Microlunatus sp.]